MADRALFLGWTRAVAGREQQAMELFQKAMDYYGKLQADGLIESFEPVLLQAHGGDLNGFVLLRSDAEKIAKIRQDDAFIDFSMEAGYCLQGFGIVEGIIGEGIPDAFSRWSKLIG